MKQIALFVFLALLMGACMSAPQNQSNAKKESNENVQVYKNLPMIVVSMSDPDTLPGKFPVAISSADTIWKMRFHPPIPCGCITFRGVSDPHLFLQLCTCDSVSYIDVSFYQRTFVGDPMNIEEMPVSKFYRRE